MSDNHVFHDTEFSKEYILEFKSRKDLNTKADGFGVWLDLKIFFNDSRTHAVPFNTIFNRAIAEARGRMPIARAAQNNIPLRNIGSTEACIMRRHLRSKCVIMSIEKSDPTEIQKNGILPLTERQPR